MKTVSLLFALCMLTLGPASASATACNLVSSNGIVCVQSANKLINTSSGTVAFSSNNTAGNLIVVVLRAAGGATSVPSDTNLNTYQIAYPNLLQGSNRLSVYYAQNIAAGANTVSVAATGASAIRVAIFEYSGIAASNALDQATGTTGTGTSPASPSVTTVSSPELAIGALDTSSAVSIAAAAGSGYALEQCNSSCTSGTLGTEDQILPLEQSIAATWSVGTSTSWASIIATFRGSGAPLTYNARTDTSEALNFLGRSTDTVPAVGGLTRVTTPVVDTDFHSNIVRATDYTNFNVAGMSFNMGSSGDIHRWSSDSKKLLINNNNANWAVLSFSADSSMAVALSNLYGGTRGTTTCTTACIGLPGNSYSFSSTNPHVLYEFVNDSENGAYVNQFNKLTINDTDPNPLNWTYSRTKMFNLNCEGTGCPTSSTGYVSGGPPNNYNIGTSSPSCMPVGYKSNWTGVFAQTSDDSQISIGIGDGAQSSHPGGSCSHSPGGTCTGAVWIGVYTVGQGCRLLNTLSTQITGDWGGKGTWLDGQQPKSGGGYLAMTDNFAMHDSTTTPQPGWVNLSGQQATQDTNQQVTNVAADGAGHTTITTSVATQFIAGQQVYFSGLTGATWLNGTNGPSGIPWPVSSASSTTSPYTVVISDPGRPVYNQPQSAGVISVYSSAGCNINGSGQYCNAYFWHVADTTIEPCTDTSCQGHAAGGYVNSYRAKVYTAHSYADPELPCSITIPLGQPCPAADQFALFSAPIPVDQHGSYINSGTADQTPAFLITANVCGQAGGGACDPQYTVAYYDEIVASENSIQNHSATHCNYGAGSVACMYRFAHTFNTGTNWNFNGQNSIGDVSPDGRWVAWPSDWDVFNTTTLLTKSQLGCTNGASSGCLPPASASICTSFPSTNPCQRTDIFIVDLESATP